MTKKNTAAENTKATKITDSNKATNKGAQVVLTTAQELKLVEAAKKGDFKARNTLYLAYEDQIKKSHTFSGMGTNPSKFGKGRNKKRGNLYEEYSGQLFEVFVRAIEKFDIDLVDFSKLQRTTPFLSFLKFEIANRAMDEVRKSRTSDERFVAMSDITKGAGRNKELSANDYRSSEEICGAAAEKALERVFDRSNVYDSAADDYHNLEIQEMVTKVISLFPKGTKEHTTLETYLQVAQSEDSVIPGIAERLHVTRATVYNTFKKVVERIPANLAEEFCDALRQAA